MLDLPEILYENYGKFAPTIDANLTCLNINKLLMRRIH